MRAIVALAVIGLLGAVSAACGSPAAAPTSTPAGTPTAAASPTPLPTATQAPGTASSGQLAFAGVLEDAAASAVYLVGRDGAGLQAAWTWETVGSHAVYLVWSPDGRQLAFFGHDAGADSGSDTGSAGLYVLEPDQGSLTRVLDIDWLSGPPVWSPDGRQLYVDLPLPLGEAGVWAIPVDGSAAPTLVAAAPELGTPLIPSPDGQQIAVQLFSPSGPQLAVMSVDDPELRVVSGEVTLRSGDLPVWSPDSQQLAFIGSLPSGRPKEPNPGQLFVVNADGSGLSQLTDHQPPDAVASGFPSADPAWSPDGQQLAYTVFEWETQQQEIYVTTVDGSQTRNLTNDPEYADTGPSWSPDGRELAFVSRSAEAWGKPAGTSVADIRVIAADGTHLRTVVAGLQSVRFAPFDMEMGGQPVWRPPTP